MDMEKIANELTELKRFLPSTMWKPINDAITLLKEQQSKIEQLLEEELENVAWGGWKVMSDRKEVITHLQIINTWAEFARERGMCFSNTHLENIAQWTKDAIAMLKEQPEIVRCKDCKYWMSPGVGYKNADLGCCIRRGHGSQKSDWFCADWERR